MSANSEQQVQQRMQQLQSDIGSLQSWLHNAQNKASDLQQLLRSNEQNISSLRKAIQQNQQGSQKAAAHLAKLQQQSSHFQDALAEQEQQLGGQLKSQYQQGQNAVGNLLLSLDNPAALARNMAYYQYLNQASAEQMAAYRQTLNSLALVQQEQADLTLELQQSAKQLQTQNQHLKQAKTKLATNLKLLNNKQASKAQRLASAKADQIQAQELLEQIQVAIAKANIQVAGAALADAKGKLPWPLKGKVLNRFGVSQSQYPLSQQGWLIAAPEGSDVVAIHGGHVVFSDWLKGYGLVIIVDHGDGFLSLYGQNQALYLSVGDYAAAQQLIASSGKSGGNTKAALYFSLRRQGKPLNPKQWLQ
ncbi:peptidoglycan DD-metalloendopeptidase family protein [Candidatus Njordibacter sp. Uisw_039]|uniref:murein hydrolase activator EnvC family protein n=1 Tax=Candidatus Njordibacter sp. Uisw_039 TaxID=3230972 RepID=UPI003D3C900D